MSLKGRYLERLRSMEDAHIVNGEGLDPYQRVAVQFLVDAKRALLSDVPGAGKTAVSVRAAKEVGAERALTITKKSLIYDYMQEIDKWSDYTAEQYTTKSAQIPTTNFVVTNYDTAVRRLDVLVKERWDAIVVDEASQIRSRKAQRAKAVQKLCWTAPYAWLLTGTPIHNRPDEIWSLLRALDKKEFSSYWRFVEEYCFVKETPWSKQIIGAKNLPRLYEVLAPYVLRRDEKTIGVKFPELLEETITLEMTPRQKVLYTEMKENFLTTTALSALAGDFVWAPNVVSQLTRLRQIACSPTLIGDTDDGCKTPAIKELLEERASYGKVLLFTNFATYAKELAKELSFYNPVLIVGGTPIREREREISRFINDPRCSLLLATTKTLGEGRNLQVADTVVFADRDWTPVVEEQAIARARRRGREDPVRVIRLVAAGTVDEYIAEVLANKNSLINEMDAVAFIVRKLAA